MFYGKSVRMCVCLIGLSILSSVCPAFATTVVDLGTLYPDTSHPGQFFGSSQAFAINAYGEIVGNATAPPSYPSNLHAFLWKPTSPQSSIGSMVDLGTLYPDTSHPGMFLGSSTAYGINRDGSVVGSSSTSGGQTHAFRWTPAVANSTTGTMVDLGVLPGGQFSYAFGINTKGIIAGTSDQLSYGVNHSHLFVYDTSMHDWNLNNIIANYASDLPSQYGSVLAGSFPVVGINDTTNVVGQEGFEVHGTLPLISYPHAFVTSSGGSIYDLRTIYRAQNPTGPAPFYDSAAYAINNNSALHIVGYSAVQPTGDGPQFATHAFFHIGTGYLQASDDLGSLAGPNGGSWAYAVNNNDRIVGASQISGGSIHACSFVPITDLNSSYTSGLGWTLNEAHGINDYSEVVGFGTHTISGTAYTRAFLYTF